MPKGYKTGGKVKGSTNRKSVIAKEAFQLAFDTLGGPEKLALWAKDNQSEFYKLYARLIPVEMAGAVKMQYENLVIKKAE